MKLLIVSPFFPYPTDSGGKTRLYYLIKELSRKHEITLLSLIICDDAELKNKLSPYCRVELIPVAKSSGAWKLPLSRDFWSNSGLRMKAILDGTPPSLSRFLHRRLEDRLHGLLQENNYDIIQFEYSQMAGYADRLPDRPAKILSAIELVHVTAERGKKAASNYLNLSDRLDSRLIRRYEASIFKNFSAVLAMSESDKVTINKLSPDSNVFVVPNGVDQNLLSLEYHAPANPRLLFVGGAFHQPNIDGLSFFMSDCWPKVCQELPGLKLRVIGRGWRDQTWLRDDKSVEIIDHLENLADCYLDASIFIAPIRIGSGTRLKILEAMAAGLPVVSTAVGCEGLNVVNGEHLLIADNPIAFSESILKLINNPETREHLSESGRRHIQKNYLWLNIADKLNAVYDKVSD